MDTGLRRFDVPEDIPPFHSKTRLARAARLCTRPLLAAYHLSGVEHGAHDLVVPGAAAQIAGQPVAGLFLGRVRVLVEQRLGRDDKARRAEAALQRRVFEEFLLHRMQLVAFGDALDRRDLAALGLDAEHQARAHDLAVGDDRAGAAIARAAAFLAAGQAELVAQHVEHGLLRLAEILDRLSVDCRGYVMLAHSDSSRNRIGARSGALEGLGRHPARQHAGDLGAVFDRTALVGDRLAGGLRRRVERAQRVLVEPVADQRPRRLLDDELGRRHRAEHDARVGAGAVRVQRYVDGNADHRDVHLGARDKALIRVALTRLWPRDLELDDELALFERGAPRPDDDIFDRHLAPAV